MKKVLQYAIIELGIFDYILFGQGNKAHSYDLLSKGVRQHCSKSFFYKCLATRSTILLQNKDEFLIAAGRYFDKISTMNDPFSGAPRLCSSLFQKFVENHNDPIIREIALRKK